MDASPFEQDQEPLVAELNNLQDYGTTTFTTPLISNDQRADPPRQAANSDNAESDTNTTSTDVQSQMCRSQQRSRDGCMSLPIHGKESDSHTVSAFSTH